MAYSNCLDYLSQRGMLPFSLSPFCEVDNLILSICAYLPFERILSDPSGTEQLSFSKAVKQLPRYDNGEKLGLLLAEQIPLLARKTAASPRFAPLRVGCCESILDEETEMQFAALTYFLPDGTLFLAFRGTDDTLVGWKECFHMSFSSSVPAQKQAEQYLARVAERYPGKLRLGGHSKGGNLAVWAAIHASPPVRNRILHVYSNDGPGFSRDLTRSTAYRALDGKISTFIPQASIVGILLHQDHHYYTIKSHETNAIGQHDPFSWEVNGPSFRYLTHRSPAGRRSAAALQGWIASMDPKEREEFTEVLFHVLSSNRAKTLSDLSASWVDSAFAMAKAYGNLDRATRREMREYLRRFLRSLSMANRPSAISLPSRRSIPRRR